jgi:hypothetical protein
MTFSDANHYFNVTVVDRRCLVHSQQSSFLLLFQLDLGHVRLIVERLTVEQLRNLALGSLSRPNHPDRLGVLRSGKLITTAADSTV